MFFAMLGRYPCPPCNYKPDCCHDDLLAEYAPDVLSGISEDDWRCSTVSGSIYGVPMNKDKAQGRGFEMVKSIADELGIDYSTPWTYEDLDANLRK